MKNIQLLHYSFINPDTRLVRCNNSFLKTLGIKSPQDAIGKSLNEILSTCHTKKISHGIEACLNHPKEKVTLNTKTTDEKQHFEWTIYADYKEDHIKGFHLLGKCLNKQNIKAKPLIQEAFLFDQMSDAAIVLDNNFIIQTWNKSAENMHQLKQDEVIGKRIDHALTYQPVDCSIRDIIRNITNEGKWQGITKYIKDNQILILEPSVTCLKDKLNNTIGYLAIIRDISDRHVLHSRYHDFISVFSTLDEGFFILNKEYTIAFVNEKANQIAGEAYNVHCKPNDIFTSLIPKAKREIIKEYLDRVYAGETISYQTEVSRKNQNAVWLNCHYFPIKDFQKNVTGICVVLKNITAQKQILLDEEKQKEAKEKLYQSRKLFEMIVEHAPLEAWVTDENGNVQYMNPSYKQSFNCAEVDYGTSLYEIFPKEMADCCYKSTLNAINQNKIIQTVEKGVKKDGSMGVFRIFKFPLYFANKLMAGGWSIDITDQVNLQEQLVNQEKIKKRDLVQSIIATQEKERRQLSIELHDNVNQILSSCKLMLEVAQESDHNSSQLIQKTYQSLQTAITEIRKISHELNPSAIEDIGILEAITEAVDKINLSGKLYIQFNYDGYNYQDQIKVDDKIAIYRIFQEQLNNILKHANASEVLIYLDIKPSIVKLNIKDNGVGFDANSIKKGIGLKNISHRVDYYRGSMKIKTAKNKGCSIEVTLNLDTE